MMATESAEEQRRLLQRIRSGDYKSVSAGLRPVLEHLVNSTFTVRDLHFHHDEELAFEVVLDRPISDGFEAQIARHEDVDVFTDHDIEDKPVGIGFHCRRTKQSVTGYFE